MIQIWNFFALVVWFIGWLFIEFILFYIFREVFFENSAPFSIIIDWLFLIYIILEAILRLFFGITKTIFRFFIGRFF